MADHETDISTNDPEPKKKTKRAVSRRSFLRVGAGAAGTVFLAACGDATTAPASTTTTAAATSASTTAAATSASTTAAATGASTTAVTAVTTAATGASTTVATAGKAVATYSGPKVELAFWNGWTGGAAPTILPKMIDQFNASQENIKVVNNSLAWADMFQKIPAAVRAGQGPDLGVVLGSYPSTYAAQSLILPVDDMLQALNYTPNDFAPNVFKVVGYKGKNYGIPVTVTNLGLHYNKKVMSDNGLDPAKPPQNNADYISMLEQLKAKGVKGSWVDGNYFTGVLEFLSLLYQFGGDKYNPDISQATYNSDAGVQALTWMVDLVKKGYSPENVALTAHIVALRNNQTAFIWHGCWQTSAHLTVPGLQWGIAPVPQIGSQKGAWGSSTHFVFYNKRGQDPNKVQAGKVFVDWFIRNTLQWATTGEIPSNNLVRESDGYKSIKDLQIQPFVDELPYTRFETPLPGIADAEATLDLAINEAMLLKKSPKQALDEGVAQANKLLELNRQQYK